MMENSDDLDNPAEPPKWYAEFPKSVPPTKTKNFSQSTADLNIRAEKALNGETSAFELKQSRTRGSDYTWLKTAVNRGTEADKVAASVVLIQDSPKHNLSRISSLVSKVKVSKSDHCSEIIRSLKDLFLNDLLHPDLKLVKFEDQDFEKLKSEKNENKLLVHWYFEDKLKQIYENFVDSVNEIACNGVESNREKAVGVLCELLIGNPEQEQKLLKNLVNKIGDPSSKVSSKTVFCLQKVLHEHPNMKGVVLNEVERLLFRPNLAPRVQYYAICLLSQFVLDKDDEDTATTLIDVYFAFFRACLKKGEPQSKMMSAILAGVNRAYRYAKTDVEKIKEHVDSVFKVVHLGSFNVSLMALNLLFQVCMREKSMLDRFYTAFYRKLLDPQLGSVSNRAMFLNLYLRAVRLDSSVARSAAFIKRMLQVAMGFPPNMICAILYIISQILMSRRDLRKLFSESYKIKKIKEEKVEETEVQINNVDETEVQLLHEDKIKKEEDIILSNITVDPVNIDEIKPEIDVKQEEIKLKPYDPFCRNPMYAGGYSANFQEINALISHFHPSVALFAKQIFNGEYINYTGDPLKDLTAIRFLDRYVFKNPKKLTEIDMKKKRDPLAKGKVYDPQGLKKIAVDSASYLNTDESKIPVDELFLYRYMHSKGSKKVNKGDDDNNDDDDDDNDSDSVNSEEFNDMLDRMGGKVDDCDDLDDLDVAADYVEGFKRKGNSKDKGDSDDDKDLEDEDLEDEDMEDLDDEEIDDVDSEDLENGEMEDFDEDENLDLDELDDDASDIDFDSEEEKSKNEKKKNSMENVFMSAEKFAEMLEEQGLSKLKSGASNALSDADGSNFKQLKWEMNRHRTLSKSYGKKNKNKRMNKKQSGQMKKKQKR